MEIQKYDIVTTINEDEVGMVIGKDSNGKIAVALMSEPGRDMTLNTIRHDLREWRNKLKPDWNAKGILLESPNNLELERRFKGEEVYLINQYGLAKVVKVAKGYVCFQMLDIGSSGNNSNRKTFPITRLFLEC